MSVLEKIVIRDFRNIALQEVVFSPNINCISGGNGEGKTNLLDAVWYLSMTKSAFAPSDRYNFRHGTKDFAISGSYLLEDGRRSTVSIHVDGESKKLRRDDKPYPRISEHIGSFPIVMVSPADSTMVSESGEERRRFINSVLSQMDRKYLADVQQYNRLLQNRNRLLKEGMADDTLLESFEAGLAAYATPIFEKRRSFCEQLSPIVARYYREISGGSEEVEVSYRSDLQDRDAEQLFRDSRQKDRILHYTSAGVQRDDFLFGMDGHPIRRHGSQGQQKSFLVALKFAQYELMREGCGQAPALLLDDLFDKLDMKRVANLLEMVASRDFGQIFLTDSNKTRIRGIVDGITADRAYIEAEGGAFTRRDD